MDIRSGRRHVVIDNLSINLAFVVFFRKLTGESNQETPVGLEWLFCLGGMDKSAHPDTILASPLNSFFSSILEASMGSMRMPMKWPIHNVI